ncbi:hypothetical protein GGS23DRAFT_370470 [Durotheca rogersii]|uniref:uncharacterized protein n=1 Tax=Durotheca rogersii TaxID=419775 RepID=UPI002220F7A8|nr:uncharacterized protein GGS23DRAFT_370470 [Durotheca rogersii]KAI5866119.1 hypothetical protein GGS23DRAFT_370470 [Durotheca rogersii]
MPLQKSFSEQNGSSRNRQHWNKARSRSACSNSAQANGKETRQHTDDEGCIEDEKLDAKPDRRGATWSPTPEKTPTPMSRLSWQDLVGIPESKEQEGVGEASPNEKIGWDAREDIRNGLKLSPVMPRKRGKKRARSSSPVSSPASNSKTRPPTVNVEKLSRALKSPHADPALELWDRFSLSGSISAASGGAASPSLAQIMISSSPQPARSLGESGLRRAISCGENWPKRRRMDRVEAVKQVEVAIDKIPSGHSKSSMVNDLLQSVTGEINKSMVLKARQAASPKKKQSTAPEPRSPTRQVSPLKLQTPPSTKKMAQEMVGKRLETTSDAASDYGDDDFDDDELMGLDVTIYEPRKECEQLPPLPTDTGQVADRQRVSQENELSDDEFADIDDEVFAAAEDLIARIDSNRPPKNAHAPLQPSIDAQRRPAAVADNLAEDLYGDDFGGDFDFEAAEIAATQSISLKKTSGPLSPVRR